MARAEYQAQKALHSFGHIFFGVQIEQNYLARQSALRVQKLIDRMTKDIAAAARQQQ
jgi:hypothetical protein